MRKLFSILLMLCLCGAFGVAAHAAGDGQQPDTAITETDTNASDDVITIDQPADADEINRPPAILIHVPGIQPIEVKTEMLGDVPYITKTYEIAEDDATEQIRSLDIYNTFEQDGYQFTRCDTIRHTQGGATESRTEVKTETLEIEKDDTALVLAQVEPYLTYMEDGFTGRLVLDEDSIKITEGEQESYGYRVTDVREYANLDRQDAAYIPKTVLKNGVELSLENVEWVVMGQTPTADGFVPKLFKAIATYSGGATGSRVSGYTATFRYSGTVEKATPGVTVYQAVFRGEKIVLPQPEPEKSTPVLSILAGLLAVMALAGGGMALLIRKNKSAVPAHAAGVSTNGFNVNALRQNAEAGYDGEFANDYNEMQEDENEENLEEAGYEDDGGYYDDSYDEDDD